MNKAKTRDPQISEEYDFSKGKRGVHHERAVKGTRVTLVTDEEDRLRQRDANSTPRRTK
jgi:hypothetical protein